MDRLAEIVATKRQEIAERRVGEPVSALRDLAAAQSPPRGFEAALRRKSADGFALIAEIALQGSDPRGFPSSEPRP
jgi:indole-3-glycerol phosphate synthase